MFPKFSWRLVSSHRTDLFYLLGFFTKPKKLLWLTKEKENSLAGCGVIHRFKVSMEEPGFIKEGPRAACCI